MIKRRNIKKNNNLFDTKNNTIHNPHKSTLPKRSPKPNNNTISNNNNFNQTAPIPNTGMLDISHKIKAKIVDSQDKPQTRFGNTFNLLSPVKAILFGGAVGSVKAYKFSNESFIYNFITQIWKKVEIEIGAPIPQERAAHAAAVINNNQLVIHGGSIGNSNLAEDELWELDLSKKVNNYYTWKYIKTYGTSPGKRYGHSLSYMYPYLVLLGGNLNVQLSNDLWIIDIHSLQPTWEKIDFEGSIAPSPRLYHTCGFCDAGISKGMMILFGGRDGTDNPLNDIWGLRRHRSGKWEWVMAPVDHREKIRPRYNHSISFLGTLMIIIGGRGRNSHESLPINIYDTESSESYELMNLAMYRQSSFIYDKYIYLYGGFNANDPLMPISDISKLDITELFYKSVLLQKVNDILNYNIKTANKINPIKSKNENTKKDKFRLTCDVIVGSGGVAVQGEEEMEDNVLFRKIAIENLREENKRILIQGKKVPSNTLLQSKRNFNVFLVSNYLNVLYRPFEWFEKDKISQIHNSFPFSIDKIKQLLNEVQPILEKEKTLIKLRAPCKIFGNLYGEYFDLMRFFESFGNPSDDNQMGDITVMQYIFLGDFCDRCEYSLETLLVLFALKVKFPDNIFLIRGHHEDISINKEFGLYDECIKKFKDENAANIVFNSINEVFEYLPLAVLIDNNVLCLHGGIGISIKTLSDIENIQRPIKVKHNVESIEDQKIIDILWSEYSDDIEEISNNNERDIFDKGFVLHFGKSILNEFLIRNSLNLIINSHSYVKEGFKLFNEDKLLTVFSASNYMDKCDNYGAMVIIGKKTKNKALNLIFKFINVYQNKERGYITNRPMSPIKNI